MLNNNNNNNLWILIDDNRRIKVNTNPYAQSSNSINAIHKISMNRFKYANKHYNMIPEIIRIKTNLIYY